jgi:hypothetical protein
VEFRFNSRRNLSADQTVVEAPEDGVGEASAKNLLCSRDLFGTDVVALFV